MSRRIPAKLRGARRRLAPRAATEERYVGALRAVLRGIGRALLKSAESYIRARTDATRVDAPSFRGVGGMMATAGKATTHAFDLMAGAVAKDGAAGLKGLEVLAATKVNALASKPIRQAIDAARKENVSLIKSAASDMHAQIAEILKGSEGRRWEEVAPLIAERVGVGEYYAERIARDQTLTVNADLIRIQQEEAGVTSYLWSTSLDERVRDEHADREGEEFDWDNPPEDGHPGEAILCRCVAIPIVPLS